MFYTTDDSSATSSVLKFVVTISFCCANVVWQREPTNVCLRLYLAYDRLTVLSSHSAVKQYHLFLRGESYSRPVTEF